MSALKSSVHTVSTELSVNGWHVGTVIIASVPFPTLLDYHHFRHHLCRYSKYCPCVYLLRYYDPGAYCVQFVTLDRRRSDRVDGFSSITKRKSSQSLSSAKWSYPLL
jgi:hypothetical protein